MAELGTPTRPGTPAVDEVTAQLMEALDHTPGGGNRRRSQTEAEAHAIAEELLFVS